MNYAPLFEVIRDIKFRAGGGNKLTQAEVDAVNAALTPQLAVLAKPRALKDPAAFFASVRAKFGSLKASQVEGFETLLKAMEKWSVPDTAYGLATAFWETNRTMQPVREAYWLSEDWRKANLRYYPHYGRGYVQLTWPANYAKADKELGLGGTLVANLNRAMEPKIAADVMVRGMEEGWFTGKKNADYAPDDYVGRRAIINGKDHAHDIAAMARSFEDALKAGRWG